MVKSLVENILKSLVEHQDQVVIALSELDGKRVLRISVHKDDVGRVIGKNGQTIKTIRLLALTVKGNEALDDIIIDDSK